MLTVLDTIHDWNCQHLDKNKGLLKMFFFFIKCVFLRVCVFGDNLLPVRVCVRMQRYYLRFEWFNREAYSQQISCHI